jgi:hypothetical protein
MQSIFRPAARQKAFGCERFQGRAGGLKMDWAEPLRGAVGIEWICREFENVDRCRVRQFASSWLTQLWAEAAPKGNENASV